MVTDDNNNRIQEINIIQKQIDRMLSDEENPWGIPGSSSRASLRDLKEWLEDRIEILLSTGKKSREELGNEIGIDIKKWDEIRNLG